MNLFVQAVPSGSASLAAGKATILTVTATVANVEGPMNSLTKSKFWSVVPVSGPAPITSTSPKQVSVSPPTAYSISVKRLDDFDGVYVLKLTPDIAWMAGAYVLAVEAHIKTTTGEQLKGLTLIAFAVP